MRKALIFLLGLLFPLMSISAEINFAASIAPEVHFANKSSPYYVGPPTVVQHRYSSRQDLEVQLHEKGVTARGLARLRKADGMPDELSWRMAQLYYDGEIEPGLGWSVGKKVLSWGIGFAFRPLDIIQRENRRQVNAPALVGIPLLALESFTTDSAWTLVWNNPGRGECVDERDCEGVAARWYGFSENNDYHAVARVSQRHRLELGGGATTVIGDASSVYGGLLYRHRTIRKINSLVGSPVLFSAVDPLVTSSQKGSLNLVAGIQWTGESGWSLLSEAFYDASAPSAADWRSLNQLTQRQLAAASSIPVGGVEANVAWSSQLFVTPNLVRENLLLRLSHDDGNGLKPYTELLLALRDAGWALTLGWVYERNRQKFSGGFRQMGGEGSIFASAPEKRILWFQWGVSI